MSGDSISRKAVIDEMYDLIGATERLEQQIVDVLERVSSEMPSAEKTGKWIKAQYPFEQCSICGAYFDTTNNQANYCCVCGAKMEV